MTATASPTLQVHDIDVDEDIDHYLEQVDALAEVEVGPGLISSPLPPPIPEPTSDLDLSRTLERARSAKAEVEELAELARQRHADIEDWLERASRRPQRRHDWLIALAEDVALKRLLAGADKVAIKLPEGKITAKYQEPDYRVDHEALGAQMVEMGLEEFVATKHLGKWADMKGATKTPAGAPGDTVTPTLAGVELRGVVATIRPPKADVKLG
ncbi:MAG TPA: hypothetical protein VIN56_10180 [Candidatus Dormibacteraeota bacterium]